MEENDTAFTILVIFISLIVAVLIWAWGYTTGWDDYSHADVATFEECKELKIDTVSYSYESDSYVLKVTKVR